MSRLVLYFEILAFFSFLSVPLYAQNITWQRLALPNNESSIADLYSSGDQLCIATPDNLYVISDIGDPFLPQFDLPEDEKISAIACGTDYHLIGTTKGNIYRATPLQDNGAWMLDIGVQEGEVGDRVSDALQVGRRVYAARRGFPVMYWDIGASWSFARNQRGENLIPSLLVSGFATDGRDIYAASADHGVLKRQMDGSWLTINGEEASRLPADVSQVFIMDGDFYVGTEEQGIYWSDSGGNAWLQRNGVEGAMIDNQRIRAISGQHGRVYAGTAGGTIFASADHGESWMNVSGADEGRLGTGAVVSLVSHQGLLIAGGGLGLYIGRETEMCDDNYDNDGDGFANCADSDCHESPACQDLTVEECQDGQDNDRDLLTDCDDNDCSQAHNCIAACQQDSDGDGTVDCDDLCVEDPTKQAPLVCGCGVPETDTDNDASPDCRDECPNNPQKTGPDVCGCGSPDVDSDGDGTLDCQDACPANAAFVANTDADGDGILDCNDGCIDDPLKMIPGICGCGTPDLDTDQDGTFDCVDACPNDAQKIAAGQCGCGEPEQTPCVELEPPVPHLIQEICNDRVDNDGDTQVDCDDADCKDNQVCDAAAAESPDDKGTPATSASGGGCILMKLQ
jgi:photosystem II stability/assembly factor-like uncharacterized protein